MYKNIIIRIFFFVTLISSLTSCWQDEEPVYQAKPRGYFKLSLPKPSYKKYSGTDCPFDFDYSTHAIIKKSTAFQAKPCWLNIEYPTLKATVYLSYVSLEGKNDLEKALSDSYRLTFKHTIKAKGINETLISNKSNHVYGLRYDVKGNSASNFQFLLTDSAKHYMHASLYFYAQPNADSLQPAAEYVIKDLDRMIESFRWH
jgi:gliding motility-associated lipoprotein GldD